MPTREEFRQLEFEDNAASKLARSRGGPGPGAMALVALVAAALVLWMFWSTRALTKRTMLSADDAEFRATQYRAPVVDTRPAATNLGRIVIQPPPAPQPAPVLPPAPPTPPPTRVADLGGSFPPLNPSAAVPDPPPPPEDQVVTSDGAAGRDDEDKGRWARLKSPMMVADNGAVGTAAANSGEGAQQVYQDSDSNSRFLHAKAAEGVEMSHATQNRRIDALVAQGTMIRGVLETAIQSDLPGMVRAVTSEDVWSFDGRRVLIPQGTRLIGEYKSGLATGQTRVFIVWTRVLRSDGVSVMLGSTGTDDIGRTGLTGEVDEHYMQRFGSAILLSIVGGGSQFMAGMGQGANTYGGVVSTYDPATGTTTTTQPNPQGAYGQQIASQTVSQNMNTIAGEALQNSLHIPPTINVDQGTRIMIFVRRDLDFSSLYPDPVREMVKALKRDRARVSSDGEVDGARRPLVRKD